MKLSNRREARKYALQYLFAQEFHNLEEPLQLPKEEECVIPFDRDFAAQCVQGVQQNMVAIDETLQRYSPKRKVSRMATVDRNILRLAIWEMQFSPYDVAKPVIINEAVQLSKEFGDEATFKFINAILDAIAKGK